MSWAADEWKDGLPQKALIKIGQIESQLERLKKDKDQKQFQLESLEQAFEVQKRKTTDEKSEIVELKRENKHLSETCKELEKKKLKLANDLLMKENQVSSLEQKVTKLAGHQDLGKASDPLVSQNDKAGPDLQSQFIKSLEQEIAQLRQQLEEKGDESSCSKPMKHLMENDDIRKMQQELRSFQSQVAELEAKNKKLLQDGDCMRHNAEAARLHIEAKMKEHERELKQEIAQALEVAKNAERVLQETKAKCQQEVNASQAAQNKLKALLENVEAEKLVVAKNMQDMAHRVASADHIIKTNGANMADIEKKKAAVEAEKEKLIQQLECKDRENQTLSNEIKKLKNDSVLKEQANDVLRAQMLDKDLERESSKAEADKLSQKLLQSENKLMDIQKQKDKAEGTIKHLSASVNQLNQDKEKLEKTVSDISNQQQKLQENVNGMSLSLKETQAQLNERENYIKESQSKWKTLENNLRQELSQSVTQLAELSEIKSHLDMTISTRDKDINELKSQTGAIETLVRNKESEIAVLDKNRADLEKQLGFLAEQHEALKMEYQRQKVYLEEKLAQAQMAHISKSDELEKIRSLSSGEKLQLQQDLEKILHERQGLEQELKSSIAQCDSSKHLIGVLENEVQVLKNELEIKDSNLREFNSVIEKTQSDLQQKTDENAGLNNKIALKEQLIDNLQQSALESEERLQKTCEELSAAGKKCEQMTEEKSLMMAELSELKRQSDCEKQATDANKKLIENLQEQLENVRSECSFIQNKTLAETEKNSVLERDVVNLQDKCSDLDSKVISYKNELEELTDTSNKLEQECSQLSHLLEVQKQETVTLVNKLTTLETIAVESDRIHQQVVGEISKKLQEALRESSECKGELEQKTDKITELEREIARLQAGTCDLEAVQTSLKLQLEKKTCDLSALEEDCVSLSDKLEAVKLLLMEKEQLVCSYVENFSEMEQQVKRLEKENMLQLESSCKEFEKLQSQISQMEEDLSHKTAKLNEMENLSDVLKDQLSTALKEISEKESCHSQEMDLLKTKLDVLLVDVEDKDNVIQNLNAKIANVVNMLEASAQERDALKEITSSLETNVRELGAALDAEKFSLTYTKSENDKINSLNQNLNVALENIRVELGIKISAVQELEMNLEKAHNLKQETDQELNKSLEEIQAMRSKICDLDSTLLAEKEKGFVQISETENIRSQCAALSCELENMKSELLEKQKDIDTKAENLETMKFRIKELEMHKVSYEQSTSTELEKLQQNLQQTHLSLNEKNSRIQELEDCIKDLDGALSKVKEFEAEKDSHHAEMESSLKSNLEALQIAIEDRDRTIQDLTVKLSNLEEHLESITKESSNFKELLDSANCEVFSLRAALDAEKSALSEMGCGNEIMRNNLTNLESIFEETRAALLEKEENVKQLQSECERAIQAKAQCQNESNKYQTETERLNERIEVIQHALTAEKESVKAKILELDTANGQCALLSEELKELIAELSGKKEELSVQAQSIDHMESRVKMLENEKILIQEISEKELNQLQQKLLNREDELEKRVSSIADLQNQVGSLKSKLDDVLKLKSEENSQHDMETAMLKSKLEMLQMDVVDKDEAIHDQETTICNLNSQIENISQEMDNSKASLASMESEIIELKAALDTEKETINVVMCEGELLKDKIKNLNAALSETKSMLDEKEASLQKLHIEQEKAGESLVSYEKLSREHLIEKEKLTDMIDNLKNALSLEKEFVVLKTSELEKVNEQCILLSEKLEQVQVDMSHKQEKMDSQALSLDHIELRVRELEAEKMLGEDEAKKELETLQQQLSETKRELIKKTTNLDDLKSKFEEVRNKFADAVKLKSEENAHHDQEAAILKSQLELLQMDVDDKDESIQNLNIKIFNLNNQLESLLSDKDIMKISTETKEKEILELKSALDAERETVAMMKIKEETLMDRVQNLEAAVAEARIEVVAKEASLQKLNTEYEKAADTLAHYEHMIKEFEEKKIKFTDNIEELQKNLKLEKEAVGIKNSELSATNEICASLAESLDKAQTDLSLVNEELDAHKQSLLLVEAKLKESEAETTLMAENSNRELNELQQQCQSTEQELNRKKLLIDGLENQIEDLRSKLGDALKLNLEHNTCYTEEAAVLKSQLELLQMNAKDKDDVIGDLNTKICNLTSQVTSELHDKNSIKVTAESLETELLKLKSTLELEREAATQMKCEAETMQERIKNFEAALDKTKVELDVEHESFQKLQLDFEMAGQTIAHYEQDLKNHQDEIIKLTNRTIDLDKALASEKEVAACKILELERLNQQSASLSEELGDSQKKLVEKEEELNTHLQSLKVMEYKIIQMEKEKITNEEISNKELERLQLLLNENARILEEKSSRIKELEICTEDFRAKLGDTRNEHCQESAVHAKETEALKLKLDLLQLDVEDKDSSIQNLNLKISNISISLETLKQDYDCLKTSSQNTEAELGEIKDAFQIERNSHTDNKATIDILQNTVSGLEASLAAVKASVLEKENYLQEMNVEYDKAKHLISQQENNLMENKEEKKMLNLRVSVLEQELLSKQRVVDMNACETESFSVQCSNLQEKLFLAEAKLLKQKEEMDTMSQNLINSEGKLTRLENEKENLKETLNSDLSDLQEILNQRIDDLNQKSSQLEELQNQFSDLQGKFSETMREKMDEETVHRKECTALSLKLDELHRDMENEKNLHEALENEILNLKDALNSLTNENSSLKNKTALLESEHSVLQESCETLRLEYSKQNSEFIKMQKQVNDLETETTQLSTTLNLKESHIIDNENQLKEMIENSENLQLRLNQQFDQIRNLEAAKKTLENQIKIVSFEKSELSKCSQDLENMNLKMISLQEELEIKSSELSVLNIQLDNLNRAVTKANLKLAELQSEKRVMLEQFDAIKKLYDEAKTDIEEKTDVIFGLREELDSTAHENDNLRTDRSDYLSREEKYKQDIIELNSKITDLELEMDSTRESFEAVSEQRFEARDKLHEALREKECLEKQLRDTEGQLIEAQAQIEHVHVIEMEVNTLKQNILRKEDELCDLKTQLDTLHTGSESNVFELDLLRRQNVELESNLEKANGRNKDLEDKLNEFTSDTIDVKEKLAQLQCIIETLNNNLDSKRKKIMVQINEISKYQDEISRLQAELESKNLLNTDLSQKISGLETIIKESSSTIGTLEDAIESLNFELTVAEEEKASLISGNSSLQTETKELLFNIDKLKAELETLQRIQAERETQLSSLEGYNTNLVGTIDSLEASNKEMKLNLEKNIKAISDLTMQITSLSKELEEKTNHSKDLSLQIQTMEAEMTLSQRHVEAKEVELCKVKDAEQSLSARLVELDYLINTQRNELDCKNEEIQRLMVNADKLDFKCQQSEHEKAHILEEMKNKLQAAEGKGNILKKKIEELEIILADKMHLAEKINDYDLIVTERDELRERIHHLQLAEIENKKLEAKLEYLDRTASLEKGHLNELEQELQKAHNREMELGKQVEKLENAISEMDELRIQMKSLESINLKLREDIMETQTSEKKKMEELAAVLTDKSKIESQLQKLEQATDNKLKQNIQGSPVKQKNEDVKCEQSDEKYKELLRKWEQRCSELNNQLTMERKKVQCLTKQVEKWKSTQVHDNTEDIKKLTGELEAAVEERDSFKEKFHQMILAGERHFSRANELEKRYDFLKSRNKLLVTLLRQEKEKGVNAAPVFNVMSNNGNMGPRTILNCPIQTNKQKDDVTEVLKENPIQSNFESTTVTDTGTFEFSSSASSVKKLNKPSGVMFSGEIKECSGITQDVKGTAPPEKGCQNNVEKKAPEASSYSPTYAGSFPQMSSKKTPQEDTFAKPHIQSQPVESIQKTRPPVLSKIATPTAKLKLRTPMNSQSSEIIKSFTLVEPDLSCKVKSQTSSKSELVRKEGISSVTTEVLPRPQLPLSSAFQTDTSSILPSLAGGPKRVLIDSQAEKKDPEEATIKLSPRVTRRMSLQKRKSTDQTLEAAGGKRSKLSVQAAITEEPVTSKNRNLAQESKLPQFVKSKSNQASKVLRPVTTRSKKEVISSGSALATITNSPKKMIPDSKISHQQKGLLRHNKLPKNKAAVNEEYHEGASECKTQ